MIKKGNGAVRIDAYGKYKHFKKMDFATNIEVVRSDVKANAHLRIDNTSRQQNIKVQEISIMA